MGLVDVFVDEGDMQRSVDPVYAVIGEEEEAADLNIFLVIGISGRNRRASSGGRRATYKGTEATKYHQPYLSTSSYSLE